jgi:hypothetical protein
MYHGFWYDNLEVQKTSGAVRKFEDAKHAWCFLIQFLCKAFLPLAQSENCVRAEYSNKRTCKMSIVFLYDCNQYRES